MQTSLRRGAAATYYKLTSHDSVGANVTKNDMISVYNDQMVSAASRGACILREDHGSSQVSALSSLRPRHSDHARSLHAKKHFIPVLAVCPNNLLPACFDCNKAKLNAVPPCASQQTLNPYYDNVDGVVWLHAKFEKTYPHRCPVFRQEAEGVEDDDSHAGPSSLPGVQARAGLFHPRAAVELEDIKDRLTRLINTCGASVVRKHLAEGSR